MGSVKKVENRFLGFYKEQRKNNRKGFNNTIIFTILSLVTLYFSINNSFVFFVSIPLTMMGFLGIYDVFSQYKNYLINEETELFNSLSFEEKKKYLNENTNSLISSYVENYIEKEKEKKLEEKEEKLKDKEKDAFHSLSFEGKKKYLNENTNSLISSYVENYIKTHEKIELLNNLIKIENELQEKFNDKFYSEINLLNFNEKLHLILNNIKKDSDVEIYRKEKVLEDKIKFFTFFQIFNDDLYNIDLHPLKNGSVYEEHKISFNNKISINENFIIKLSEILKNTEKPFVGRHYHVNRYSGSIYLKTLIENHVINNYEKIVGDILKIESLHQLYKKYKDLQSRMFLLKELGIGNRLDKWNYMFYEEKNVPEVIGLMKLIDDTEEKNYTVEGEKVLNEINLILEKLDFSKMWYK